MLVNKNLQQRNNKKENSSLFKNLHILSQDIPKWTIQLLSYQAVGRGLEVVYFPKPLNYLQLIQISITGKYNIYLKTNVHVYSCVFDFNSDPI